MTRLDGRVPAEWGGMQPIDSIPRWQQPQETQLWGPEIGSFNDYVPPAELTNLSDASFMSERRWRHPIYKPGKERLFGESRRDEQLRKLRDVGRELIARGVDDPDKLQEELDLSLARTERAFDLYEGKTPPDFDGSFAFIVPTRISRDAADYGDEIVPYIPIVRHVDNATRQRLLAGTCPWVLDIYQKDGNGRQGAMVFAPVFKDIVEDKWTKRGALATSFDVLKDTVEFSRDKLGAEVAGLGATLPLIRYLAKTRLGRDLDTSEIVPTSGHGGTVWLLGETIARARNELKLDEPDRVGIIGQGGIGYSTADYLLSSDPNVRVNLYDIKEDKLAKASAKLAEKYGDHRVNVAGSVLDLMRQKGGVIVSAVTSPIDLRGAEYADVDLTNTLIVDDSQPHAVVREAVEEKGGKVAWVIGEDGTLGQALTFVNNFNYGGWGPAKPNEVWGCQAEAGAIHLEGAKESANMGVVTPEIAKNIGAICAKAGIGPAALQSFGRYL